MIKAIDQLLRTRAFQWLRVLQFILALGIFSFAALMPNTYVPGQHSDTSLHFLGNLLLFLSAAVACYGRIRMTTLLVLLLPYSIAIELAQGLTPSRQVDPKDMLINVIGLLLGCTLVYLVERAWRRLNPQGDLR